MHSDDGGDTWQLGGDIKTNNPIGECQAVDLGNNAVLVNARSNTGPNRYQSLSTDGGMTFSEAQIVRALCVVWPCQD